MISSLQASQQLNNNNNSTLIQPEINGKGKAKALVQDQNVLQPEVLIDDKGDELFYRTFQSEETDLPGMMRLVEQELSEPLVYISYLSLVFTFRYFLIDWPHLAFLVFPFPASKDPIATIICKQDFHRAKTNRGYIAMLSVDRAWRRRGIASRLVELAITEMARRGAHEVVLETEYDNEPSLSLYDRLGFLIEKRLHRFYSNQKDAFRLILPLETDPPPPSETVEEADQGRWKLGAGSELGPIPEDQENETIPPKYFIDDDINMGLNTPKPQLTSLEQDHWGMYT
ncbi:uncharacterized protein L201_005093 [Kwoniella dendrophila CBS 6074]|uniref:N-acetyltransferase domain-containing protein n=1 Tax=Kwoniella dendrophila CBS 6074 TaxID=1295534 RepID=A0AAX4JXQ7_9TREE